MGTPVRCAARIRIRRTTCGQLSASTQISATSFLHHPAPARGGPPEPSIQPAALHPYPQGEPTLSEPGPTRRCCLFGSPRVTPSRIRGARLPPLCPRTHRRSEEHTSELQ